MTSNRRLCDAHRAEQATQLCRASRHHITLHAKEELKIEEFKPGFAGKMNFYLSAVDDLLRQPADEPSLDLILCKEHNRLGVSDKVILQILRYANVTTTMNIYTKALTPAKREAQSRVVDVLLDRSRNAKKNAA